MIGKNMKPTGSKHRVCYDNGNAKIAIILALYVAPEAPMAGAGERTRWKDD
jgi:hypothetical protein